MQLTRRQLMKSVGALGALAPMGWTGCGRDEILGPGGSLSQPMMGELETLTAWLAQSTPPDFAAQLVERISDGVTPATLNIASFAATLRTFEQHTLNHAGLVYGPVHRLTRDDSAQTVAYICALRPVHDWSIRWVRDNIGDLVPYIVTGSGGDETTLSDALLAYDETSAVRATVALHRSLTESQLTALLWRLAVRDFTGIGHRQIGTAESLELSRRLGWSDAEPVLRALARRLAHPEQEPRPLELYQANVARTAADGWEDGAVDATISWTLTQELVNLTADQAAVRALALLEKTSPDTVWDGLVLSALNPLLRGGPAENGFNVHCFTTVNAMRTGYSTVGDAATRLLILLSAASFVRWFPATGDAPDRPRIHELEGDANPDSAADILAVLGDMTVSAEAETSSPPDETRMRAAAERVLGAAPATLKELIAAVIQLLPRKLDNVHHLKFAAAVIQEAERVSEGLVPALLAGLMFYCNGPDSADLPGWQATAAAIEKLKA